MTFVVGRSGSSEVAEWWKDYVPAGHNTYNADPGALNFAFVGSLELTIGGSPLRGQTRTLLLEHVALAQGHKSNGDNNWWFGGETHCAWSGADEVRFRCTDDFLDDWYVWFKRTGVDVVEIVSLRPCDG